MNVKEEDVLNRNEMKVIMAGSFTDEYGCSYTGGSASCRSYYDCLTGICTSQVSETGWDAAACVEEVQTLRLSC
jgi:hypothetical protein